MNKPKYFILFVLFSISTFYSQSSNEIYLKLKKLNFLGSLLSPNSLNDLQPTVNVETSLKLELMFSIYYRENSLIGRKTL